MNRRTRKRIFIKKSKGEIILSNVDKIFKDLDCLNNVKLSNEEKIIQPKKCEHTLNLPYFKTPNCH